VLHLILCSDTTDACRSDYLAIDFSQYFYLIRAVGLGLQKISLLLCIKSVLIRLREKPVCLLVCQIENNKNSLTIRRSAVAQDAGPSVL
jgi:hypothetical protein